MPPSNPYQSVMDSAVAGIEKKARAREEAERLAEEQRVREEAARAATRDAEQSIIDGIILPELQKAAEVLKQRYPDTFIDIEHPDIPALIVGHGGMARDLRFTSGQPSGIVTEFNGDIAETNTLEEVRSVITRFIQATAEQFG